MAPGGAVGDRSVINPFVRSHHHGHQRVATLLFLGALTTALGFFVAGNIQIVIIGLVAVFGAGLLQVLGTRRA